MNTLSIEVTHKFDGTTIDEKEFTNILDIASWRTKPYFPNRGRMAWYVLQNCIHLTGGKNRTMLAAKIKGVGGFNPTDEARNRDPIYHTTTTEPFQPTNVPLLSFASYPHLGFDEHGEYTFVLGNVAPIGGILHERATTEYQCAMHLLNHDVPAIVPMAVIRYDEGFSFNEKRMGAVICISPSKYPYRLSEVQFHSPLRNGQNTLKDEYYSLVYNSLEMSGDPNSEQTRLKLLKLIAKKVGKLVHTFSTCGLYRYSSELINFEFDFNTKNVILTDLDSSGFIDTLPAPIKRLQVLRDMGSMIYHFLAKFANPLALGNYSLNVMVENDPLVDLICGYFPFSSRDEVAVITKRFWRFFIPHFMLINRHRKNILEKWTTERRRSYKMDHDLFFILAITSLYPIFCKSDLSILYPDENLTEEKLLKKAKSYLGERFEYFEYLMTSGI